MNDDVKDQPQLFVLRLWRESLPDGNLEWRGRIHHTQTNEVRYFRDWPALIPSLLLMLRQAEAAAADKPADAAESHDQEG